MLYVRSASCRTKQCPGEKLYDALLFGGEDVRATHHPKVLRASSDPVALKDSIREIVPEFSVADARTDRRLRPSPSPIEGIKQVRELS